MIDNGGAVVRPGEDPSETLKRADGFLYRSKEAGRNRVTCG
jgi:PleD family two-component response regulator